MTLDIRAKQTPFRVSLGGKQHSEVFVSIQNKGDEAEMASLAVETSRGLGFDASGLKHYHEFRINELKPNESKHLYVKLFPVPQSVIGENAFTMTVREHLGTWDLVKRTYTLNESVLITR